LTVQPFASLPGYALEGTPRVLINKEIVGDLGSRPDDVLVLGDCDEGVRKLADALGWRDELEQMWLEVSGKASGKEAERLKGERHLSKDEELEAEIEKLTGEVDAALKISKEHTERTNNYLEKSSSSESSNAATPKPSDSSKAEANAPGSLVTDVWKKYQSKDQSPSTTATELPPAIEPGRKEPPSTPAAANTTPLTTEKTTVEAPAQAPAVDSKAILDVTLPQNKPDAVQTELSGDQRKPVSRI